MEKVKVEERDKWTKRFTSYCPECGAIQECASMTPYSCQAVGCTSRQPDLHRLVDMNITALALRVKYFAEGEI
jgi:tRNA(Ile2) C34 agmatinyltransferase TiaS